MPCVNTCNMTFTLSRPLFLVIAALFSVIAALNDTPWVLVCSLPNWEGRCAFLRSRAGQCTNFPGDWNDIISSIRNDDPVLYRCTWFEDVNCAGRSNEQQEDPALNNGSGFFDDRVSSWICERREDDNLRHQKPLI